MHDYIFVLIELLLGSIVAHVIMNSTPISLVHIERTHFSNWIFMLEKIGFCLRIKNIR